jgi:succinoglycan biosynthesis transport protein ExoP
MKTQFTLLLGKNLAKTVARKLNLSVAELAPKAPDKPVRPADSLSEEEIDKVAARLLQMVDIEPIRDTNLCEITFTTPNPGLSQRLAHAWAEQYVEQHLNSIQQYKVKAEELLAEQVQHLQKEIAEKEKQLYDYSIEKQIVKPDKTKSMSAYALTDVNSALVNATRDRISAEVRYRALAATSRHAVPEVMTHHAVQQALSQYNELKRNYEDKSKIYKPNYPEMTRLEQQIEQMRREVDRQSDVAYQEVLAKARSDQQQAYIQEGSLRRQLEKAQIQSVEAGRKELNYDQIVMEIENKKLLLTSLLQKHNEVDVSSQIEGRKATTTRIIEFPELPKSIHTPNIQKNIVFSVLAGLFAGIALALGLEFFDRTIRSPEDVERFINIPFLGIVPQYAGEEPHGHGNGTKALATKRMKLSLEKHSQDLLSTMDPMSAASEAIKTVRTSLLLAFPSAPPKSILITSSRAGEGKTFIATNLAIALTQLDKRVVIIDADMRNPRVHRIWNAHNDTGLSIYLTSDVPVTSVMRPSSVNNLTFISSGPKTPRPAELLASERFSSMLEQLEKDFDFVILDSPPVLPVADSVILASRAKSVVMVVYGGATQRDVVRMAKRKLSASNPVIVGAIVNGLNFADPYYYYRYYSNYTYSYYGKADSSSDRIQ